MELSLLEKVLSTRLRCQNKHGTVQPPWTINCAANYRSWCIRSKEETLPRSCSRISTSYVCTYHLIYRGSNIISSMLHGIIRNTPPSRHSREMPAIDVLLRYISFVMTVFFFSCGTSGVHTNRAFYPLKKSRPSRETRNSIENRVRKTTILHPPRGINDSGVNIENGRALCGTCLMIFLPGKSPICPRRPQVTSHIAVTQIAQSHQIYIPCDLSHLLSYSNTISQRE